jgi:thymidylate synthase ThyX
MKPRVTLIDLSANAYNHMVATARTCYSAKGLVSAEQVGRGSSRKTEDARFEMRDRIASSIYRAGHHTTLQHAQARFALEGVSRHFIWTFLHSHPFYNSEQVSQRYVPVKDGHWVRPPLSGEAGARYDETVAFQSEAYRKLTLLLMDPCRARYLERFPARENWTQLEAEILKRAQEAARYLLPLATTAYLHHTVSVLTLMRYHRICRLGEAPRETEIVVQSMVDQLLAAEPEYARLMEDPLPPEDAFFATEINTDAAAFREEFDSELCDRESLLVGCSENAEHLLADAVREVLGRPRAVLTDDEALAWAMDPARNRLWGETLNLSTMNPLARPLYHPHYSFRRRISHSADSQDQRHRMTPASRPSLLAQENGEPDFATPTLIAEHPEALRFYETSMMRIWDGIAAFRSAGGSAEDALYLLPNAKHIRYTESADLLNLRHKAAMRLCYNAQEEIWRISWQEALQVRDRHPRLGAALLPPCNHRKAAGAKPICPEGDRYCGVPVWKLGLEDYERVI